MKTPTPRTDERVRHHAGMAGAGYVTATFARQLETELTQLRARAERAEGENAKLKECLEPGKASAIVNGIFRLSDQLGLEQMDGRHALTKLEDYIKQLRAENAELRAKLTKADCE